MDLEEKEEKYSLIPLLIEYSKLFGKAFPLDNVKHLTSEELIDRIETCIKDKNLYNPQIFKLDKLQKMSESDMKKIINLVIKSIDFSKL